MNVLERSAIISQCGKYRYRLWRKWAESERMPVLWIMLNPSTADASVDDATIRRCMRFSELWGFGAMWVGNLFAWRSTDPMALWGMSEPERIGPDNERHLIGMAHESEKIVCAWGNHGGTTPWLNYRKDVFCPGGRWLLGRTGDGSPAHPLGRGKSFIPYDRPLTVYRHGRQSP